MIFILIKIEAKEIDIQKIKKKSGMGWDGMGRRFQVQNRDWRKFTYTLFVPYRVSCS